MKKYYFISGLPRTGSTLLCNILAQNPKFHTSSTSGIMDVLFGVKNNWDDLVEFKATPDPEGKKRVMKGILENYYSETGKEVVFDKCRGWLSLIEMAEYILDEKVKILVPVRDLRDVVSSFERLWRLNNKEGVSLPPSANYFDFQTVRGRVEFWLKGDQPVGIAFNRIKDALQRGFGDRLHFVHFEELTFKPEETMKGIYDFLGEEYYPHDFDNVEQVNHEDDTIFGFKDLHKIRPKVEPVKPYWREIIGEEFESLADNNFK